MADLRLKNPPAYSSPTHKDASDDFLETSNGTYTAFVKFPYDGTRLGRPIKFIVVGSKSGGSGVADFRLYNVSTGKVIAEITGKMSADIENLSTFKLTNLPSGSSVFEIQARTNGDAVRVHGYTFI